MLISRRVSVARLQHEILREGECVWDPSELAAKLTCIVCVFPLLVTPYAKTVPAFDQAESNQPITELHTTWQANHHTNCNALQKTSSIWHNWKSKCNWNSPLTPSIAALTTGFAATSYTSCEVVCGPKTLSAITNHRSVRNIPNNFTLVNHFDHNLFTSTQIENSAQQFLRLVSNNMSWHCNNRMRGCSIPNA